MTLPPWLTWRRIGLAGCAAFFVLAVAGGLAAGHYRDALSTARADVTTAVRASQAAIAGADSAERAAAAAVARADSLQRADSLNRQRADSLKGAAAGWQQRYRALARTAPDTCAPVLAAADSLIATSDSARAVAERRLADAQAAAADLRAGLDTLRAANRRLAAAAARTDSAALTLVRQTRPPFLARIAPRPGVGVAAGVDPLGRPAVLIGVTLGWSKR